MKYPTVWQWYHYYHQANITTEIQEYPTKSGGVGWMLAAYDHSGKVHNIKSGPAAAGFLQQYEKGQV